MGVPELSMACRALGTRPLCVGGWPACWAEGRRVGVGMQPAGWVPVGGGEGQGCWPSRDPRAECLLSFPHLTCGRAWFHGAQGKDHKRLRRSTTPTEGPLGAKPSGKLQERRLPGRPGLGLALTLGQGSCTSVPVCLAHHLCPACMHNTGGTDCGAPGPCSGPGMDSLT